jgi:hypothetical protein
MDLIYSLRRLYRATFLFQFELAGRQRLMLIAAGNMQFAAHI